VPKRCGHFADKRVIPSEEMVLKIKAAVKAKSDPDFVIFARIGLLTEFLPNLDAGARPPPFDYPKFFC
jgi:2-methylisocitrate lyase-like PEP mutase family enzyme